METTPKREGELEEHGSAVHERAMGNVGRMEENAFFSNQKTNGSDRLKSKVFPWTFTYYGIPKSAAFLDFIVILIAGLAASSVYHLWVLGAEGFVRRELAVSLFVAILFVGIFHYQRLYSPSQLLLWNAQYNHVLWIWCVVFFVMSGWLFVWKSGDDFSRGAILSFWALGLPLLLLLRTFWRFFLDRALRAGSLRGRRIVLASLNNGIDTKLANNLIRHGYELRKEFVLNSSLDERSDDDLSQLITFVRGSSIEEVLLLVGHNSTQELEKISERLHILPLPVTWIVQGPTAQIARQPWFELGPAVAVEMQRPPHGWLERALKRTTDVIGAGLGLFLLLPLLFTVAVAIKMDTRGPIIFWQTRKGFNGKSFLISKFRSMNVLEDGTEIPQAKKIDNRVTRVGKFLRKTSIDELPQLYNVLIGDMSLVGPRPHAAAHDDAFLATVADYAYRNHVKPGITGWAQVHGYRGETPNLESIQRRVEFDRWYINNWNLWLDFSILIRTVGQVIRGRNAY